MHMEMETFYCRRMPVLYVMRGKLPQCENLPAGLSLNKPSCSNHRRHSTHACKLESPVFQMHNSEVSQLKSTQRSYYGPLTICLNLAYANISAPWDA